MSSIARSVYFGRYHSAHMYVNRLFVGGSSTSKSSSSNSCRSTSDHQRWCGSSSSLSSSSSSSLWSSASTIKMLLPGRIRKKRLLKNLFKIWFISAVASLLLLLMLLFVTYSHYSHGNSLITDYQEICIRIENLPLPITKDANDGDDGIDAQLQAKVGHLLKYYNITPSQLQLRTAATSGTTTTMWHNYLVINHLFGAKKYNHTTKIKMTDSTITYTTHATGPYLHHLGELCDRWDGPISVAVYAIGTDLWPTLGIIQHMRQCLPYSDCIVDKINWHLVLNVEHLHVLTNHHYYNTTCEILNSINQLSQLQNNSTVYRNEHSLPYPINVLRNVARYATFTTYHLASDIELYPSVGLVPAAIELLRKNVAYANTNTSHHHRRRVYVLPIFEVDSIVRQPPKTVQELIYLYKRGLIVHFHQYVCDRCQHFPYRTQWMQKMFDTFDDRNTSSSAYVKLQVFTIAKRTNDNDLWEPIYIGTSIDPYYDQVLYWEGKRDKMIQAYEMCLLDYEFAILEGAFLVHAPGIKRPTTKLVEKTNDANTAKNQYSSSSSSSEWIVDNNNWHYERIIGQLKQTYGWWRSYHC